MCNICLRAATTDDGTTLVSETSNSTTMDETSSEAQAAQEAHRKLQCQGCLQLKKARKELKRVKQELRAAHQLAYTEQQRAQSLQSQLDLSATETTELKRKLARLDRSVSEPVEGWFDVCADFRRRTRRRPNKSRGITWQRRYLVARSGRLHICKGPGQWDAPHPHTDTVIDIDDTMTISCPSADDPEVFLLNRDPKKVIKISYHRSQPSESSSASDCSESTTTEPQTCRVVMLEAPSVEEKQNWMSVLTRLRERATSTGCQEELISQHPVDHPGNHDDTQMIGSMPDDEVDVSSNFHLRRAYVMRCLKVRHDSEGSQFSSATSSVNDLDLELGESDTGMPKRYQSNDDESDITDSHDNDEGDSIPQQGGFVRDQRIKPSLRAPKITQNEDESSNAAMRSEPASIDSSGATVSMTKQFCQFDETKMAALLVSVVVVFAALMLMSQATQ